MLTDWYFCSCIRANPVRAAAYLSILDTLDEEASPPDLVAIALEELRLVDIWMQVHAYPRLLRLSRRALFDQELSATTTEIVAAILDHVDEELVRPLNDVASAFLEGGSATPTISALLVLGDKLRDRPRAVPSVVPYLDLVEFIPETLALATMAILVEDDATTAHQLSAALGEVFGSSLSDLLDRGCAGTLGRAALNLALSVRATLRDEGFGQIVALLSARRLALSGAEPDVLALLGQLLARAGKDELGEDVASRLVDESVYLREYANVLFPLETLRDPAWPAVAARLGDPDRSDSEAMLTVLWQLTLWERAGAVCRLTTARALAAIWRRPATRPPERFNVTAPGFPAEWKTWRRLLSGLARLGKSNSDVVVFAENTSPAPQLPPGFLSHLVSPWFSLTSKPWDLGVAIQRAKPRYPSIETIPALVRLLGAAAIAPRLLATEGLDLGLTASLAAFVVHASDVLQQFTWLRSSRGAGIDDGKAFRIPEALLCAAINAERTLRHVGEGYRADIGPDKFLAILEEIRAGEHGTGDVFIRIVLPEVLVQWIGDGFTWAHTPGEGTSRWLDHVEAVHGAFSVDDRHGYIQRNRDELILRFLHPHAAFDPPTNDWRTGRNRWGEHYRRFLLSPPLPAEEWVQPDWTEPQELRWAPRIVRATERVAALRDPGTLPPRTADLWRREWRQAITTHPAPHDLDPFVRLRLLELLESEVMRGDLEGQLAIVFYLLEGGNPYELRRLYRTAYSSLGASPVAMEIRQAIAIALVRDRSQLRDAGGQSLSPRPVFDVRNEHQGETLRSDLLSLIAFAARTDPSLAGLADAITREIDADVGRRISPSRIRLDASLAQYLDVLEVPADVSSRDRRDLLLATTDRIAGTTELAFDNLDDGRAVWLDRHVEKELNVLLDECTNGEIVVGGLIAGAFPDGKRWTYEIDCGLPQTVHVTTRHESRLELGCAVSIVLSRTAPADGRRGSVTATSLGVLGRVSPVGSPVNVRVDLSHSADGPPFSVRLPGENSTLKVGSLWRWDPNLARAFFPDGTRTPPRLQVFASATDDGVWQPVSRAFPHLLLHGLPFADGHVGVFAIIDFEVVEGESVLRLGSGIGTSWTLRSRDVPAEDWHELTGLKNQYESLRGLLVTLAARTEGERIQVGIVRERPTDAQMEKYFPALQLPFDARNLAWHELFADSTTEEAGRDHDGWFVDIGGRCPAGFPSRIRLLTPPADVPIGQNRIEVAIERWDEVDMRRGCVQATAVPRHRLRIEKRNECAFLERWLAIAPGSRFEIDRTIARPRQDGSVRCLTREGVAILVDAETLSLRPIASASRLWIPQPRVVEVASVRPSSKEPSLVAEELPLEVREARTARGVLVEVPSDPRAGGTLCRILWLLGGKVVPSLMNIGNIHELSGAIGAHVSVRTTGDTAAFTMEVPNPRARALWRLEEPGGDDPSEARHSTFLGLVEIEGERRPVAELAAGWLCILPHELPGGLRHLDALSGVEVLERRLPEIPWNTTNVANRICWSSSRRRLRKSILTLPGDETQAFHGECDESSPSDAAAVHDVSITLIPRRDGWYDLRRYFDVRPAHRVSRRRFAPDDARLDSVRGQDEVWRQEWTKWMEDSREVAMAMVTEDSVEITERLRVPDGEPPRGWRSRVPILRYERPHIAFTSYPKTGLVQLVQIANSGPWYASYRRVEPMSPEEFRDHWKAGSGEPIRFERAYASLDSEAGAPKGSPATKLHYVGVERSRDNDGKEQRTHLFEWGYGFTLAVEESRLRYDGGPVERARFQLFHGDVITEIAVHDGAMSRGGDTGGDNGYSSTTVEIREADVRLGEVHELFVQSTHLRIVHVLRLEQQASGVVIDRIMGFARSGAGDALRTFTQVRARMAPEDATRIARRFAGAADGESGKGASPRMVPLTILGRLVVEGEYFDGRDLVFRHVRMSLRSDGDGDYLVSGDRTFMAAGRIYETSGGNDRALEVHPLADLAREDVGPEMRNLGILRRNFSARENLLDRVVAAFGDSGLRGNYLLVRIWQSRGEARAVELGFREGSPSRDPHALASAVRTAGGQMLTTVVEQREDQTRLEIDAGIFVDLPVDCIEESPADLAPGSVVGVAMRAESRDGRLPRFLISRAAFSDFHYVADAARPGVALPITPLLRKYGPSSDDVLQRSFWSSGLASFTLGDLPNVLATMGAPAGPGRWRAANPMEGRALMEHPHPKIVSVAVDASGSARISPPDDRAPAGRLVVDAMTRRLTVALLRSDDETVRVPLPWRRASFGDEPIKRIEERMMRGGWRYHDAWTGFWRGDRVEQHKLTDHNSMVGPIFFDGSRKELTLRYAERDFHRFGLPIATLVEALERDRTDDRNRTPRPQRLPVAGVTGDGGLWVEIAPGRIVEIPFQLIVRQTPRREYPLADFHWRALSAGDLVELRLASSDPLTVDRIALVDWIPGSRNAFGRSALLPLLGSDPRERSVTYGAGTFSITLPANAVEDAPALAALSANNDLRDGTQREPHRGDTVLLVVNQGRVDVAGYEELEPLPDRGHEQVWMEDPLWDEIIERGDPIRVSSRLRTFIAAAGGALPVTVEAVANGLLFYTRRNQAASSKFPESGCILGRVSGALAGSLVLVRIGGGFAKLSMDQLVSGIPRSLAAEAAARLRDTRTPLWFRLEAGGRLTCGLMQDDTEFAVRPVAVVGADQGPPPERGMICQASESGRLYWLPEPETAWAPLAADELQRLFVDPPGITLTVIRAHLGSRQPAVSVVKAKQALFEFRRLGAGQELNATILIARVAARGREGSPTEFLAQSTTSRVVMTCEPHATDSIACGTVRAVEVVRRGRTQGRRSVAVTPLGSRCYEIDIPLSCLADDGAEGSTFEHVLNWIQEEPEEVNVATELGAGKLTDPQLVRRIAHGYATIRDSAGAGEERGERAWDPLPSAESALEWLRRHQGDPEVPLHVILMCAVVLHRGNLPSDFDRPDRKDLRGWLREVAKRREELHDDLARRRSRSVHVDVLRGEWFGNPATRDLDTGLWGRLKEVKSMIGARMTLAQVRAVRSFCRAVEVNGGDVDSGLDLVASALRASMGEGPNLETIDRWLSRDLQRQLREICRTFDLRCGRVRVLDTGAHERRLRNLLETLFESETNLILLAPVPRLEPVSDGE